MRGTFCDAESFDQDVSGWSVDRVRNMSGMWWGARSFNQPLSAWNVSCVVAMDGMFGRAAAFNQSLSDWEVTELVTCRGFVRGSGFTGSLLKWKCELLLSAAESFDYK